MKSECAATETWQNQINKYFFKFPWRKKEKKVLVTRSFLALCDPMVCNPTASSVHEILKARILEWVAIPFPGDFPNPGIEPRCPAMQEDSLPPA